MNWESLCKKFERLATEIDEIVLAAKFTNGFERWFVRNYMRTLAFKRLHSGDDCSVRQLFASAMVAVEKEPRDIKREREEIRSAAARVYRKETEHGKSQTYHGE